MRRIFIGYDNRQAIAYNVAQNSFNEMSSVPLSITALRLEQLPMQRTGLTPFTWSRFLVPYLCDFQGWALFTDLDVVATDDVEKLFQCADDKYAVMTANTNPAFERAAVMLFNCAHPDNRILTPEFIETAGGLHQCKWTENIGFFDNRWNHLIGYDAANQEPGIVHYTMGIPCHPETKDCEHNDAWRHFHKVMNSSIPWIDLMGNSVHAAKDADGNLVPRYKLRSAA